MVIPAPSPYLHRSVTAVIKTARSSEQYRRRPQTCVDSAGVDGDDTEAGRPSKPDGSMVLKNRQRD